MPTLTVERHLPPDFLDAALREDVGRGLASDPKWLPPKWFYDERGSALFERITRLPEYYLTRAERQILTVRAGEIALIAGARTLVELGSGSSAKTGLLLDAMREEGSLERYAPVDVSDSALDEATRTIAVDYPGLAITGLVADFETQLGVLPVDGRRMIAFLGSTIGNLDPVARARFLAGLRASMRRGDHFLLGTDLVKNPETLVPAYEDAAGVTADFNRNVLRVVNRELGADFDLAAFEHVAVWDGEREWIEMRLRSTRAQRVTIPAIGLRVSYAAGEQMRTEISAKFRRAGVEAELSGARLRPAGWWEDRERRFAVSLWAA